MMKAIYYILLISVLLFSSCNQQNEKIAPEYARQALDTPVEMTQNQALDNKDNNLISPRILSSQELYEKGLEQIEQQQYLKAIDYFQQALPNFDDKKIIYFQLARVTALEKNIRLNPAIFQYLSAARKRGWRAYRVLLLSEDFALFRKDKAQFSIYYTKLFGQNDKAIFKAFIALAPKNINNKALKIELEDLCALSDKQKTILSVFNRFIPQVSDRAIHNYEGIWNKHKNFTAVIMSSTREQEFFTAKSYYLVCFDKSGKEIDQLLIGDISSMDNCQFFEFKDDASLQCTHYSLTWVDPTLGTKDLTDNLLAMREEDKTKFILREDGHIVQLEEYLSTL